MDFEQHKCEFKELHGFVHDKSPENKEDISSFEDEDILMDSNSLLLKPDEVMKLIFTNLNEADTFYFNYGKALGFDIRRCHLKTDDSGMQKNREWVCSREGYRKDKKENHDRQRQPRSETRCGCEAKLRVAHDINRNHYKVTRFVHEHNHPLETRETAHRLRCYRGIPGSDKVLLSGFTDVGIRPCQAMDYLESVKGGPGKLGFKRKDGYNYLNNQRMKMISGGDVNTTLAFFDGMKLNDKDLVVEYTVDDDQTLTRLFWADGMSRKEYELFGDVLIFDSTYKTNTYRFPLVIFAGVNNHYKTCIFGAALLYNETIETYQWLLRKFKEAMKGKTPTAVLTDQDTSMRAAILLEFPFAKHRICSWHLNRNAVQNVRIPSFTTEFSNILSTRCSVDEFECRWKTIVEEHGVTEHPWVVDIYKKKELWCEAYFRGCFMAMTKTTQRSESMNALVKISVKQQFKLMEFLKQYHNMVMKIRSVFFERQKDSEETTPFVTSGPLHSLKRHAASVFTKKILNVFRKEIDAEQSLLLEMPYSKVGSNVTFRFGEYEKNDENRCSVSIDLDREKFQCECLMLESDGVPCRHLISAFKCLRIKKLPNKCIIGRWTIAVGTVLRQQFKSQFFAQDPQRSRFAHLNKECANLCFISSQTPLGFKKSLKRVREESKSAEEFLKSTPVEQSRRSKEETGSNNDYQLLDPPRIRPRGAPRAKKQKCGSCGQPGHKASTCPANQDNASCHRTCPR